MNDSELNGYVLNVAPDLPDIRDWPYQPALVNLERSIDPPRDLHILDQKHEGACTGFGLAAVINYLNQQRQVFDLRVSARMLYEMAKRHDEWEGNDYSGSSCRGAIKGWHHTGVADEKLWKYTPGKPGHLTLEAAKDARKNTIGAYYRVAHRISDFHAAINEAKVLYCSARVHEGWGNVKRGVIPFEGNRTGGHAFAIVGYNLEGFWVQNSWGESWGDDGLAIWTYEDWQQNIQDAWVLRLGLPTPKIWHLPNVSPQSYAARINAGKPPVRADIAGHFVHIDDGRFHEKGKYWSNLADVKVTAGLLSQSTKYDHVLLYAHGGLNSPADSARRIYGMKEVFKDNRVYPYHFMYDTGILEELKDVIFGKREDTVERAGGITDASDWLLEKLTRIPGRALWREMKRGARLPFNASGAGTKVLQQFLKAMAENNKRRKASHLPPIQVHLVGHSTGAILLGWMLDRLSKMGLNPKLRIDTVSLMAPASTIAFYDDRYVPRLSNSAPGTVVKALDVFNLNEKLEKDDSVGPYRKSLLYLVSRAFEEEKRTPILGMQRYAKDLPAHASVEIIVSDGKNGTEQRSESETHGGFDNDVPTMNAILKSLLGKTPDRPFTKDDLNY